MDPEPNQARGVLLVNLGTPDAPTPRAVRRYLREFLGDPFVVDLPRILWWPLLNGVILPRRSRASARLYERVWTEDGSPLLFHGKALARALALELGPTWHVELGMRYGAPGLAEGLANLRGRGVERPLVAALFPQESHTTTGTIRARVRDLSDGAPFDLLASFPDDPGYIEALAQSIRAKSDRGHLLFSFHGIPQRYADRGDPYPEQCERTANALATRLNLAKGAWSFAYQSRFGREPWLQPYTAELAPALAKKHGHLTLVCPAFVADCLETTDEIGVELEALVRAAGGSMDLVPCLNASAAWTSALAELVRSGPREAIEHTPAHRS